MGGYLHRSSKKIIVFGVLVGITTISLGAVGYHFYETSQQLTFKVQRANAETSDITGQYKDIKASLEQTIKELETIKTEDQRVRNDELEQTIKEIEAVYDEAVVVYEELVKLREATNKTADYDGRFAKILTILAEHEYTSASAELVTLKKDIAKKRAEIAASFQIPQNAKTSNDLPGNGYSRQVVQIDIGSYLVDIIAADLNSTRVIVDTASDGNCGNDCPVLSLADYASRSGAYAGINGPYFCPASYPSCAGKTNSFDTLLMNKNKTYFNSDNNVYSTVPAVIFSGGSARWVSRSLEWGRDTGVDSVIASQPLLIMNGNITYGGDSEVKRAGKGTRSFIGSSGSTAYIGVVHNANVAEVARVLHGMGMQNALNLDSGGSTALMSGGRYLAGPGRNTPFGILFIRK